MATVGNLANASDVIDEPLTKYNRTNAGSPSAVTPLFVGEIILDITNDIRYRADDLTAAGWRKMGD